MSINKRIAAGRRAEARALHPRYYAMHPESMNRKLRKRSWAHFQHVKTGVLFRLIAGSPGEVDFRLPRGEALFPVQEFFAEGAVLLLAASERLQERLPAVLALRITIVSCGQVTGRAKSGHLHVQDLDPTFVQTVTSAM